MRKAISITDTRHARNSLADVGKIVESLRRTLERERWGKREKGNRMEVLLKNLATNRPSLLPLPRRVPARGPATTRPSFRDLISGEASRQSRLFCFNGVARLDSPARPSLMLHLRASRAAARTNVLYDRNGQWCINRLRPYRFTALASRL